MDNFDSLFASFSFERLKRRAGDVKIETIREEKEDLLLGVVPFWVELNIFEKSVVDGVVGVF